MNLLPVIVLAGSLLLGNFCSRLLKLRQNHSLEWSASWVIGVSLSALIYHFLSLLFGIVLSSVFLFYLLSSLTIAWIWLTLPRVRLLRPSLKFSWPSISTLVIVALMIISTILFYRALQFKNGGLSTLDSTYGDYPFHLAIITRLAYNPIYPPTNPAMSGVSLVYPYFIDLYTALLVRAGMSLALALFVLGVSLSLSFFVLVYQLAHQLTRSRLGSTLALIFYFLNGGVGFYYYFANNGWDLGNLWHNLVFFNTLKEYTHYAPANLVWVNTLTRMMVPERSLLLGVPLGIIILLTILSHAKLSIWDELILGLFISALPLLHTHTALCFLVIIPLLFLAKWFTTKKITWFWSLLRLGSISLLFFLPHLSLFTIHLQTSAHFFRFHFGWVKAPSESFLAFWFKNTLWLIPAIVITLVLPGIKLTFRALLLSSLILFGCMNYILFSPFDWDNIKFLFWIGLFGAIAYGRLVASLFQSRRLLLIILAVALTFMSTASALLSVWRETHVQNQLYSVDSLDMAQYVKTYTSPTAIFATYPDHNSPINNLAGRVILMGYPGTLWVHGIDYGQREANLKTIFAGTDWNLSTSLLQSYHVDYILIGNYEPTGWTINRDFISKFPRIYANPTYQLYRALPREQ